MSDTGPLPFPPHGPAASDAAKSVQDPAADSASPPPRRLAPVLLGCLLAIVAGGTGGALLRLVREPEPAEHPLRPFRRPGPPVAPGPAVELPTGSDPADTVGASDLPRPLPTPEPPPGVEPHPAAPSSPGRIATARTVSPRPPRAPHPTLQPSAAGLAVPKPGQPGRPASIGPKPGPPADVAASPSTAATASELLASARTNLAQDRLENAVDLGRKALAAGAGLDAHLVIGSALMKARRPREAEREFEAALSLDPGSALAIRRLEQARERIAAEGQAPPAPPASTSPPAVDKSF